MLLRVHRARLLRGHANPLPAASPPPSLGWADAVARIVLCSADLERLAMVLLSTGPRSLMLLAVGLMQEARAPFQLLPPSLFSPTNHDESWCHYPSLFLSFFSLLSSLPFVQTRLQAQAAGYSYSQAVSSAPCSNCGSPWPDPITRRHLASYQLSWLSPASDVVGLRDGHHASRAAMSVSRAGLPFAAAGGAACEVSCDFPAPSSRVSAEPPLKLWAVLITVT